MKQIILNHIDVKIWNNQHVQFQPHSDVNILWEAMEVAKPHS